MTSFEWDILQMHCKLNLDLLVKFIWNYLSIFSSSNLYIPKEESSFCGLLSMILVYFHRVVLFEIYLISFYYFLFLLCSTDAFVLVSFSQYNKQIKAFWIPKAY